jgi:hypothetical protein
MKTKKPDIFLGITMCMLVLAAVLCIVILFVNKSSKENPEPSGSQISTNDTLQPGGETGNPINTGDTGNPTHTDTPVQPVELKDIDEAGLKAALDDALRGLTSEWEVMVIDPAKDVKVSSTVNCKVDDWMTANRMTQVFIMGAVFQQAQDGTIVLDAVLDDVKAMITGNDTYAADRLTETLGGGDAAKGRQAVKDFAEKNGLQLGFNRPNTGTSSKKNYVTAKQTAEILSLICRGELVSDAASRQMLEILLTPMEGLEIETGLTGENVRSGFIADVESGTCICAMGVVQLQNRSFVISVVCNKPVTTDGAKKKVTELISLTEPFFAE